MVHRRKLVGCSFVIGLVMWLSTGPVLSQDTMGPENTVANELFEQGMSQFEAADYPGARETLLRVDPMRLTKEQRVALYETMREIDRRLNQTDVTASELLQSAAGAMGSGRLSQAQDMYRRVLGHPQSSEAQKETARLQLLELERLLTPQANAARQALDAATQDIQAGRLDIAERRLRALKESGVDLGAFDNQRLEQQMAVLAERRAAEASGVAPSRPVEQGSGPFESSQWDGSGSPNQAVGGGQGGVLDNAKQLKAQEKLSEGRKAEQAGQIYLAAQLYEEAVELDPQNREAHAALAAVQSQLFRSDSAQGVLEAEIETRKLRGQAAAAEFKQLMDRAVSLLETGSYAAAREAVQQAKIVLDVNQRFLPMARYRTLRESAVSLAAQVTDAERLAKDKEAREVEQMRQQEAQTRRLAAMRAQQEEVQQLLRRAAELRREQKYDQALELLNQAMFLDPSNVATQAMKEMIEDSRLFVNARNLMRDRNRIASEQSNENLEATIPHTEVIMYPPDWPELTATRMAGLDENVSESEINRRVALKLRESVPINFENNKLANVIEYLRQTTNVNFFVNWPALEALGVTEDLAVTLQLTNIPADQALKLILQQVSASKELEDNPITFSIIEGIVTISTERDLSKTTETRTYDIRDLLVQVPNFINPPVFDLNEALSNTNSGGSSGSSSKLFEEQKKDELRLTREETVQQITGLIQDTVGRSDEWAAYGGTVSSLRELNGLLIVKTTPENHKHVGALLRQLRETRAIQIAVESRFLIVDQNFLDEVGVDFDVKVDGPSLGKHFGDLGFNQESAQITERTSSPLTPTSFQRERVDPTTRFPPLPGNELFRSMNFGASYIDDIEVNLMIRATQANKRSFTLTAPRLTLFNGQRAYVVVADQLAFVSDLEPIPNSGGFDPTISVTQAGVILDVEATVSADRRYVTMTVQPALATLKGEPREIPQATTVIIPNSDLPVRAEAVVEAPELELTNLRTTVSVPDRGTLLLGGQRLVSDVEIEAGVPVLSKIPILSRLFTNRTTQQDERTLLILVKPTIIIQSEEEQQVFPGLLQAPQDYGFGSSSNRQ